MKRLVLLIIMLLTMVTLSYGQCEQPLKVGWRNWMPYAIGTDNTSKNAAGLDVEILRAVMETAGCRFQFTKSEIPWKRQLLQIKEGELNLVFGVPRNLEREKYGMHTDQYRSRSVALFVRRGQINKWENISSIEDLPNLKINIGVVRGYSYGTVVDKILGQMSHQVYAASRPKQIRLMLTHRRIDGYLAYLPDESILINDNDLDHRIQLHPMELVYTGGIHFFFSKKSTSQATVDIINKGLKTIKTNGKYDKIINKYSLLYGINQW